MNYLYILIGFVLFTLILAKINLLGSWENDTWLQAIGSIFKFYGWLVILLVSVYLIIIGLGTVE